MYKLNYDRLDMECLVNQMHHLTLCHIWIELLPVTNTVFQWKKGACTFIDNALKLKPQDWNLTDLVETI